MTNIFLEEWLVMAEIDIKESLKRFRKARDWTQQQIADKLGLKRTTYTSYEQGKAKPPSEVVKHLKDMGFEEVGNPMIPASSLEIPVPYIGMISAGTKADWTDPFESDEMEFVPSRMGDARGRFCCRILSDSCYDLLWPNDLAVFQRDDTPRIGCIFLFRSFDNHLTVKQLKHDGRDFILHPLNPKYEDQVAEGSYVGYLVGIVREAGTREVTVYDSKGIRP